MKSPNLSENEKYKLIREKEKEINASFSSKNILMAYWHKTRDSCTKMKDIKKEIFDHNFNGNEFQQFLEKEYTSACLKYMDHYYTYKAIEHGIMHQIPEPEFRMTEIEIYLNEDAMSDVHTISEISNASNAPNASCTSDASDSSDDSHDSNISHVSKVSHISKISDALGTSTASNVAQVSNDEIDEGINDDLDKNMDKFSNDSLHVNLHDVEDVNLHDNLDDDVDKLDDDLDSSEISDISEASKVSNISNPKSFTKVLLVSEDEDNKEDGHNLIQYNTSVAQNASKEDFIEDLIDVQSDYESVNLDDNLSMDLDDISSISEDCTHVSTNLTSETKVLPTKTDIHENHMKNPIQNIKHEHVMNPIQSTESKICAPSNLKDKVSFIHTTNLDKYFQFNSLKIDSKLGSGHLKHNNETKRQLSLIMSTQSPSNMNKTTSDDEKFHSNVKENTLGLQNKNNDLNNNLPSSKEGDYSEQHERLGPIVQIGTTKKKMTLNTLLETIGVKRKREYQDDDVQKRLKLNLTDENIAVHDNLENSDNINHTPPIPKARTTSSISNDAANSKENKNCSPDQKVSSANSTISRGKCDERPSTPQNILNGRLTESKTMPHKPSKKSKREIGEEKALELDDLMAKRRNAGLLNVGKTITDEMRVINPQAMKENQILIPSELFGCLKPHQIEGVVFLWDRIFEKPRKERGAILAHSMGLGKTLQAITFIYVALLEKQISHVLIVAPSAVVDNWIAEFKNWLGLLSPSLYSFSSDSRLERKKLLENYEKTGGVIVLSQKMISTLLSPDYDKNDKKLTAHAMELKNTARRIFRSITNCCVVDEGHMLTKEELHLTRALNTLETRNRIALTGTPLQNNLTELYQLINWVRPNYWKMETFNDFYSNPIKNGMKKDSNSFEVGLMKKRAFLLIRRLKPLVDRKNVDILKADLPPKTELVIGCKLTDFQRRLYEQFLNHSREETQLFSYWHWIMKIVNHPDIARNSIFNDGQKDVQEVAWASDLFDASYKEFDILKSSKLEATIRIIEECLRQKEKILIFSQFTKTLSFLEEIFARITFNVNGRNIQLKKGHDWYRMDGSVPGNKRQSMVDKYNDPSGNAKIFLISTKAGGMGINLVGATRILIYDVLWNPMWNSQALFRSYRYGQNKPVFVYRLCTIGSIEEVLWNRCTAKSWLFEKIVNETNPTRTITFSDLELRPRIEESSQKEINTSIFKHDPIFSSVYDSMKSYVSDVYTYDSLYEEDFGDTLTEDERKEAEIEEQDALKVIEESAPTGLILEYMRPPEAEQQSHSNTEKPVQSANAIMYTVRERSPEIRPPRQPNKIYMSKFSSLIPGVDDYRKVGNRSNMLDRGKSQVFSKQFSSNLGNNYTAQPLQSSHRPLRPTINYNNRHIHSNRQQNTLRNYVQTSQQNLNQIGNKSHITVNSNHPHLNQNMSQTHLQSHVIQNLNSPQKAPVNNVKRSDGIQVNTEQSTKSMLNQQPRKKQPSSKKEANYRDLADQFLFSTKLEREILLAKYPKLKDYINSK